MIKSYDYFLNSILKVSEEELGKVLSKRKKAYDEHEIAKKNKLRTVYTVNDSELKMIQKNLNNFLMTIPLSNAACGFRNNKSYKDFLTPHIGPNRYYLRLDVTSFFNSLQTEFFVDIIKDYIQCEGMHSAEKYLIARFEYDNSIERDSLDKWDEYEKLTENEIYKIEYEYGHGHGYISERELIIQDIINLTTMNGNFLQGVSTSPTISNIIFRRMDIRIKKYCRKYNVFYTRYADDLLFSSEQNAIHQVFFSNKIKTILNDYCLKLNSKKKKGGYRFLSINGFVLGDDIHFSRTRLKSIIQVLLTIENKKNNSVSSIIKKISSIDCNKPIQSKEHLINYLAGYRSFLIDWVKIISKKKEKYKSIIHRIELAIEHVDTLNY